MTRCTRLTSALLTGGRRLSRRLCDARWRPRGGAPRLGAPVTAEGRSRAPVSCAPVSCAPDRSRPSGRASRASTLWLGVYQGRSRHGSFPPRLVEFLVSILVQWSHTFVGARTYPGSLFVWAPVQVWRLVNGSACCLAHVWWRGKSNFGFVRGMSGFRVFSVLSH